MYQCALVFCLYMQDSSNTDTALGGKESDMFWVIGFGMAGLVVRSVLSIMNTQYYYDSLVVCSIFVYR